MLAMLNTQMVKVILLVWQNLNQTLDAIAYVSDKQPVDAKSVDEVELIAEKKTGDTQNAVMSYWRN